ncbi:MAG: hypothetical protein KC910_26335, partial [Candidatus Eremiobacteraeota bacterium]|nr:hypothetical protein [Candidatus Eremiobacteraeota bacterium]
AEAAAPAQDRVELSAGADQPAGNKAVKAASEAIGLVAGAAAGTVTVAVCAANYPVAAVTVGVATAATVLTSEVEPGSPLENKLVKTAVAVGAGVVAGVYAPAVAGAAAAVATEHLVTQGAESMLNGYLSPEPAAVPVTVG